MWVLLVSGPFYSAFIRTLSGMFKKRLTNEGRFAQWLEFCRRIIKKARRLKATKPTIKTATADFSALIRTWLCNQLNTRPDPACTSNGAPYCSPRQFADWIGEKRGRNRRF